MMLIKRIIKKLLRINSCDNQYKYFDCPVENLKMSNISLDLRNPIDRKYISVGKDSSVNATCIFETSSGFIKIADRVFVGGGAFICRNSIKIEENVQIAWGVTIYDHNAHSFDYKERQKDIDAFLQNKKSGRDVLKNEGKNWDVVHSAPIHICKDAWIGMNCIILNGVTIGEGAIIGAGSVVRDDIPAWSVAIGNPCKVVSYNRYRP